MKPLVAEGEELRRRAAKALGHMKAFPLFLLLCYSGLNRTIHLNQSTVHAALVPEYFLFTRMTSSSFHE